MRTRTLLAACGPAVAVVTGAAGTAAARSGPITVNGDGSRQSFGNTTTGGILSPQIGLIQGSPNEPCVGPPLDADIGSPVDAVPVAVRDADVLGSPQNQQCTEGSSQVQGDGPLSYILSDDPLLSDDGVGDGR